ncbi:MAG: GNAT family N-acetyltransferase, partial [Deltaproteobacteria bacterium]|nr:GNAT family N-acetyltransferase [Deltaproteobacteria bacterium]
MDVRHHSSWQKKLVSPQRVLERIESGKCIFLSAAAAEPRTLMKSLITDESMKYKDLDLIQIISLGEAITSKSLTASAYRLKTFYSGAGAKTAISTGKVDLIPERFSRIHRLIGHGKLPIDIAFIQIAPPEDAGYCSLGIAVDVARQVIEQASLVVGEINDRMPSTFGDTFVALSDFDFLVRAAQPPVYLKRPPVDAITDQLASKVASLIEDRSCIAFSSAGLYEALGRYLAGRRDLGVHSPYFTDALMDLVRCGAVTNRFKQTYRGRCVTSYAFGTQRLLTWLNRNPLVEFQSIEVVFDPIQIGRNQRFIAVFPASKIDLSGRVLLDVDTRNVCFGPETAIDMMQGAELSEGGKTIFAIPSRDSQGNSNIQISLQKTEHLFALRENTDTVVTEYGIASLSGKTLRERAQAL